MNEPDMNPFEPISFRNHTLKNRCVIAPMTTYSSHEDGTIHPEELAYLHRRAVGGFGSIMTAACYVHPSGHAFRGQWGCHSDEMNPSLQSVANAIQAGGSKAILQIHHGGRQCPPDLAGGECISASAVPYPREGSAVPREMTEEEILRTIQDFADATRRARRAGFDGVEIHGANTYLLQQFVSPASNLRTDRWNASDLLLSQLIVEAVLAEAGEVFIGYRFSPEESEPNGLRLEHTERLIEMLCGTGLDFLHVSLRRFDQQSFNNLESEPILAWVHRLIAGRKPLIGVGEILTASDAQDALNLGCEMVAIGRAAVSEPEWVNKSRDGQPIRTLLPAGSFSEELTVPSGLAAKIDSVPGWFARESA